MWSAWILDLLTARWDWKLKQSSGFIPHREQTADDVPKTGGRNDLFVFLLQTTIMCFQTDVSLR